MNFEEQRKAYQEDPVFHQLVNVLLSGLEQGQFTVGELRNAATFAGTKFESERVRPILLKVKGSKTKLPIKLTKSQKRKLKDKNWRVTAFIGLIEELEKKSKDSKKILLDEVARFKGKGRKSSAEGVYQDLTRGEEKEEKKEIKTDERNRVIQEV